MDERIYYSELKRPRFCKSKIIVIQIIVFLLLVFCISCGENENPQLSGYAAVELVREQLTNMCSSDNLYLSGEESFHVNLGENSKGLYWDVIFRNNESQWFIYDSDGSVETKRFNPYFC